MATITFRTDPAVDEALADLVRGGRERSAAIREAILTAWRVQEESRLRAEAAALADDRDDLRESRAVLSDLESLRAW